MKRIIALLLALMMCLTLCACGHIHEFGEWVVTKEATCTEDGSREHTCSDCGEVETEVIPAMGHDFSPATYFAPKTCANCGLTEGDPLGTIIEIGDVVESDKYSITVSDAYFTSELRESHGYVSYLIGSETGKLFVLQLSYTNLDTDPLDDYNSNLIGDIKLKYADKYKYEGKMEILNDDNKIVPLDTGMVYLCFDVPETLESDTDSSIIVTFKLGKELYVYVVQMGTGTNDPAAGGEETNTDENLQLGDVRSDGENYSFILSDIYFTNEVREKHGNVTYTLNTTSGTMLVLELDYTNISEETITDYDHGKFENIKAVFNEKYNYDGNLQILIDEIVPLADGKVYVTFDVSDSIEDSSDPLVATFKLFGDTYTVDCRQSA